MRIGVLLGLMAASMGAAWAQAPAPVLPDGTRINAELKSKLDTKLAKAGDTVTAVTTSDVKDHGVKLLPRGSRLTGHVTQVIAAESNKSPSRIAVEFVQATTKQGQVVPLQASIARIDLASTASSPTMNMGAAPLPPPQQPSEDDNHGMDMGGNMAPPPQMAAPSISAAPASNEAPIRVEPTVGGSILTSPRGDLQLEAGTRIELRVQAIH